MPSFLQSKRLVLLPLVVLQVVFAGIAALLLPGEHAVGWIGAICGLLALPVRLGVYFLAPEPRTDPRLDGVRTMAAVGALLTVVALLSGSGGIGAVIFASAGLAGAWWYVFVYSLLDRMTSVALQPGRALPELELVASNGSPVASSEWRGRPAVLVFYRGNWCPLCVAQLHELAGRYRELRDLGARVIAISPQSEEKTAAIAAKVGVPIEFCTDPGNAAARRLGIAHRDGVPLGFDQLGYDPETVFPTVVIVDADGVIRWADETDNYRLRPEPETFVRVLREVA